MSFVVLSSVIVCVLFYCIDGVECFLSCHVCPYLLISPPYPLPFFSLISFDSVSDLLEPVSNGKEDNCFISKSYDAASHFEACAEDVLQLYKLITGTELDMNISADMNEEDM